MKNLLSIFFGIIATFNISCDNSELSLKKVFVDDNGIIRWTDTQKEVALFGANYCLPSACDYRAAGLFTADKKKAIEQDMAHFARMEFDALRLCLWGDWENTDKHGNLIVNDHLDLMDYLIAKAREREIYMLLSPIVTYSSLWPDAMNDTASVDGISIHFKKSELGTNPEAIEAQCNYWKQLLNHVNPYTGIALKDEPFILFLETINEPWHHSDDVDGSVAYINALIDAIRSTGCDKLIFHNYSQDNQIGKSLKASNIDGASFAWYPTGLNSGRTLQGNRLRSVDDFPPMLYPDIKGIPRIVYEFDSPDLNNGYMYPAMMRTFKSVGAQFATMFSYDMLVSAPYNQGWNTHLLNMVYTPSKTVSAILAAHAMKKLPLYQDYGKYPENTSFGDFKVSYEEDLGLMNTPEVFIYSNSTTDKPQKPESLGQIIGVGSSPLVQYDGLGIYFLDKIKKGTWRLEVYPDALTVEDPFGFRGKPKEVIRLIHKEHSMTIDLPGLNPSFGIFPVNEGNVFTGKSENGQFTIRPGVYVLTSDDFDQESLPKKIGMLGFSEFVCPPNEDLPVSVVVSAAPEYVFDKPISISAQVASTQDNIKVELMAKLKGIGGYKRFPMNNKGKFIFTGEIPAGEFQHGILEYYIEVISDEKTLKFEKQNPDNPKETAYSVRIVNPNSPLVLLNPEQDQHKLSFSRIGDNIRHGLFKVVEGPGKNKAIAMSLPTIHDPNLKDYTASLIIKDRIQSRLKSLSNAHSIKFKAKGNSPGTAILSLVEADGTTWMIKLDVNNNWKEFNIAPNDLIIGKGVKLPQAFPENWSYWIEPACGRGGSEDKVDLSKVERLLISLRPLENKTYTKDPKLELGTVLLDFKQ